MSLFFVDFSNKTFVCFTSDFSLSVILSGGEMSEWCAVSKIDFSTLPKAFELKTYFSCFPIFQTQFSVISSQNTPDTFCCQTQKIFGKGGKNPNHLRNLDERKKRKAVIMSNVLSRLFTDLQRFFVSLIFKIVISAIPSRKSIHMKMLFKARDDYKVDFANSNILKWNSVNLSTQRCVSWWLYNHVIIHRHNMA